MSCLQSPCRSLIFGVNCCFSGFRVAATMVLALAAAPPACDRSIVLRLEGGRKPPWAGDGDVTEFTQQSSCALATPATTTLTVSGGKHFHPPSLLLAFSLRQIEGRSTCSAHLQNLAAGLHVHIFNNAATAQLALMFLKMDQWDERMKHHSKSLLITPYWFFLTGWISVWGICFNILSSL